MLQINIPGVGDLTLTDLILDYNGTLAFDGILISGVKEQLIKLSSQFNIHIVTGDTHGTAREQLANIPCHITIIPPENQTTAKLQYLNQLNRSQTIAIGNGTNDQDIIKEAQIGIVVLGQEGAAASTIMAANIIMPNILDALALLQNPKRLVVTLRK